MTERKDQDNHESSINYSGTVTGRISTKGPTIQSNAPRTLEARLIHDAFINHGTITGRATMQQPNAEEIERFNVAEDARIEALIADYEASYLPEWAIGRTDGEYVLGAQLPTRDGRRTGNAHIVGLEQDHRTGGTNYVILTDAGTELVMDADELDECFYPPKYVSDVKQVIAKFDNPKDEPDLRPGLEWAIARCKALQTQGFTHACNGALIKDFQNCLGDPND
ncbi:hypothetical protein [Vreelandella venusta]|uniref:hypothetical protein n=1 Tax=Vreelandella venusta TaxID=44935 RepID=UPI00116B0D1A|nr:hypothetical protein [Halomonas venusta]GEK52379.1 hypothetical protein HVE01_31000 [Halomonas venusta]